MKDGSLVLDACDSVDSLYEGPGILSYPRNMNLLDNVLDVR